MTNPGSRQIEPFEARRKRTRRARIVASLIVRNERGRYLAECVASLSEFCDEIRVVDDDSDDGSLEWLVKSPKVSVWGAPRAGFYAHEGAARQRLLDWTLQAKPDWVLALDADELISDGPALRAIAERTNATVLGLCMTEVWKLDERNLHVRCDGGWHPYLAGILWKVPRKLDETWRIPNQRAAGGREPEAVRTVARARGVTETGLDVLHLGYANQAERNGRYQRYASRGSFGHNPSHVRSILDPDNRVRLERRDWPEALRTYIPSLVKRANPE